MIDRRAAPNRFPSRTFLGLALPVLLLILTIPAGFAQVGDFSPTLSASEVLHKYEEKAKRGQPTTEYTEIRRYVLRNAHFTRAAEMDVRVVRRADGALDFTIMRASGSEQIFRRILEGEKAFNRLPAAERSLEDANYEVRLRGTEKINGRNCYVLQLLPRRASKYLLQGHAWIDAETFGLVKLEGRPTASISFWVGKPRIVREFREHQGAWVASVSRTISSTRLLGISELCIEHTDHQVLDSPQIADASRRRKD